MEKKCIICGSTAPTLTNSARISACRQACNVVITWPRDLQTMLQHFGVIKTAQHILLS